MKRPVIFVSILAVIGGSVYFLGDREECEQTEFTPPHGDTYVVDVCPGPDGPELEFVWNKGGQVDTPSVSL